MPHIIMNGQTTFNFEESAALLSRTRTSSTELLTGLPQAPFVLPITRPIHYLGSKLRIVDSVRELVDKVDPFHGPVCDLFSGSGTVSLALSDSRTVTAVDAQEYSRVLCSALLHPARLTKEALDLYLEKACWSEHARRLSWAIEPMVAHEARCRQDAEAGRVEPLCELLENASLILFEQNPKRIEDPTLSLAMTETVSRMHEAELSRMRSGLVMRYFGGIYFSYLQASQLDMFLEGVGSLPRSARNTVVAAILSTASDLVNTVGKQFAQPIRPRSSDGSPKPGLAERVARDRDADAIAVFGKWVVRYLALPPSEKRHRVWRCDYREALNKLKGKVSVVYADPPYTRDHYSRFYHVLETLCLRDFPAVSTVRINNADLMSRGVYRAQRYQSPFCVKSKAPEAFSALFSGVRRLGVPLILSYSPYKKETGARPRLVSIKELVELAQKSFRSVEAITPARMSHSKLNRVEKNKPVTYVAETFLVCEP